MTDAATGRAEFAELIGVSRETMIRLDIYAGLLIKWNKAINLVSPSTLSDIWTRHFLDSAQLFSQAPAAAGVWADLGSGAGFPGLVVACMAVELRPDLEVICIESDRRKATFLQTIVRELGLKARVVDERIEDAPPCNADIVSARALAPVEMLLAHTQRHLKKGGTALFLKGSRHLQEIRDARKNWLFDIRVVPSKTDVTGAVLILGEIRRE